MGFDTSAGRDVFLPVFRTNGRIFGVRQGEITRYLPESIV